MERLTVTAVAARGIFLASTRTDARRPMVSADAAQTLTGRLVHRLLQFGQGRGAGDALDLAGSRTRSSAAKN